MAILRRLATHSRRMQKIGLSDLSNILYNARAIFPSAMGKIKMGGPGRSFGARVRQTCLGCEFWHIRRALCRPFGKSGLTYPIVLCGRSVYLVTLPMCQIWSGKFNPFPR